LSGLTADSDIDPATDLFGKTVTDFQSDIEIEDTSVSGILNYIDDYSSAGYTGEEASGNYLVLHFEVPDVDDVEIQTTTNGRTKTLDEDGILIAHIADKDSQTITVVASKEGYASVTKVYDLSGLICETENG
jgi:spore germination protein GerM